MRRHGQTQMPCPNWTHSSVTADINVALSLVHNLFHLMEYFFQILDATFDDIVPLVQARVHPFLRTFHICSVYMLISSIM